MVRGTPNKASQCSNASSKNPGPSCSINGSTDIYDSEAAQNVFFNAPKVTRRQFVRRSVLNPGTVDEEESEQQYDENNDVELSSKIARFMQEFISKKITANNAFETQILEKLNNVVEVESLQCVGTMLDASARVYAFRVDNTHVECFTVRTTIDESKNKRGTAVDDPKNLTTTSRTGEIANNMDEDNYAAAEEDDADENELEDTKPKRTSQRKTRNKEIRRATEHYGHIEDLLKKAAGLAERFAEICLPDEVIDEDSTSDSFQNYVNQMEDLSILRRVKIPFLNEKPGNINRNNDEYGIDDPIYHKVAKQFEEGCAQSFVNNEVLTNEDGSFLILHTNWKNDEPNIAPKTADFSTKYDSIFDQLEGSLERALSREPCNLTLLQEFCEEDSDAGENSMEEIRVLGRTSQTVKRLTQNQLFAPTESSTENDAETSSVISATEEEKSRKAQEELAKFQMFLDDENDKPTKRDPFDGEYFFENDFSELALPHSNQSDIHKAIFHAFSDDDAAVFGIPTKLMGEIRMSLKSDCLLSQELQQKLFDVIGPENLRRLEVVLDTKDLRTREKNEAAFGCELVQSLDFYVTRFAPLIDSVWHATIKKATEEQLSKVGFYFGSKGLQRPAVRLGVSAMRSTTKQRARPYFTPLKTPMRPTPLVTPDSRGVSTLSMSKSRLVTSMSTTRKKPVSRLNFFGDISLSKKGKRAVLQEVSSEDNVDPGVNPFSQVSTPSTAVIDHQQNYVYFWARPRNYPKVYLGQTIDDKDNPMQSADLLDIDEVLGLNGEDKVKRSNIASQSDIKVVASEQVDDTLAPIPEERPVFAKEEILEAVNQDEQMVVGGEDDDPFQNSVDYGDDLELDLEESMDCQVGLMESGALKYAEETNQISGILKILNQPHASLEGELSNADEVIANVLAKQEPIIEDDSHWKGGPKAIADQIAVQEAEAIKKIKIKQKRHKIGSQVNNDFEASLLTQLPESGKVDVVGTTNFSDTYDPMDLISRSLLYKRKSGYWKNTINGPEYVKLRSGYAVRTVEEDQRKCMDDSTLRKRRLNITRQGRSTQKNSAINPQDVFGEFGDMKDEPVASFYDLDTSPMQSRYVSLLNERFLGSDKDEQLEFNGGIIKIRQSRVKPLMVKRAITAILSSKENDLNAMQSIFESSPVKKKSMDIIQGSGSSNDADDDAFSDDSDDEERDMQGTAVLQGASMNGVVDSSAGFKIEGDHRFSSLCAFLPDYLSGRTKQDLNVVNTFAITLIICNQNNLHLIQEVDPKTGLVSREGMFDFKIEVAKQ